MKTHNLKTVPKYYQDVVSGRKPFEIRINDRDFEVGDVLHLQEFDPWDRGYTGESCDRKVTYLFDDADYGISEGYVCMGIVLVESEVTP